MFAFLSPSTFSSRDLRDLRYLLSPFVVVCFDLIDTDWDTVFAFRDCDAYSCLDDVILSHSARSLARNSRTGDIARGLIHASL